MISPMLGSVLYLLFSSFFRKIPSAPWTFALPVAMTLAFFSCGDNHPLPNAPSTTFYITRIAIDNHPIDLNNISPLSDVSLNPIAYISFSKSISSINKDTLTLYVSLVNVSTGAIIPLDFRQESSSDSALSIFLPAGTSLEKGIDYTLKIKQGLSVYSIAGTVFRLRKNYSFSLSTARKSGNTDLSVTYGGKMIVPSGATAFVINLPSTQTAPGSIDIRLLVNPDAASLSLTNAQGNSPLALSSGAASYTFSFNRSGTTLSFIVEAENGAKKTYTVTVNILSGQKGIGSFSFKKTDNPHLLSDADGVITNDTIRFSFPNGTDITNLLPTISHNGKSISPDPKTRRDFTQNVSYNITADDGSVKTYAVKVTVQQLASYTVSFVSNGGSAVASQTIKSGDNVKIPTPPTKASSVFENWYSNAALTSLYVFTSPVTTNLTLYAKWNTVKYTVSFNTDGGSAVPSQMVNSGAQATLPFSPPAKNGLYLVGWFTKANASPSDTFSFSGAISRDTTIYAKWISLFGQIIKSGKIPNDIFQYNDPLIKETIGNGNYQTGATIAIKHVKYGGDDNNDGSSWSKAYASVSKALSDISDASSSKMYVALVAASPNEYAAGASMAMKNNTAIIGGFAAAQDGDYSMSQTDTTILSGNNAYRVFDNSNLNLSALLYGVKVVKGASLLGALDAGGGMRNNNASISVTNVILSENKGQYSSALINVSGSNGIFKNTLFINNYSAYLSAVEVQNSKPIFLNSIFARNTGGPNSYAHGVVLSNNASAIFINTNFSENGVPGTFFNGDAMFIDESCNCFPIVVNSLFSGSPDNSPNPQNIFLGTQAASAGVFKYNNFFISGSYVYQYIHNGQDVSINPIRQAEPPYVIIEDMTEVSPSLGVIGANGGFIPTMSIPKTSSAVNLGLYVKASSLGSGNNLYFSEDKISWFNLDDKGRHVPVVPPADAKDLTDTDARGYKRADRPDAGAYEATL